MTNEFKSFNKHNNGLTRILIHNLISLIFFKKSNLGRNSCNMIIENLESKYVVWLLHLILMELSFHYFNLCMFQEIGHGSFCTIFLHKAQGPSNLLK